MQADLDKKLVEDFPLLYSDRYTSIKSSCMPWGFPGNGWEKIIRKLSEQLELLIQECINADPYGNCRCGCSHSAHWGPDKKCKTIFNLPYCFSKWWVSKGISCSASKWKRIFWRIRVRIESKFRRIVNKFFGWLCDQGILFKKLECSCALYSQEHPRASQAKEKWGTLRFYMTSETDEMSKLISIAEKESAKTCEDCGKPGKLRKGSWTLTLCKSCNKKIKEKS